MTFKKVATTSLVVFVSAVLSAGAFFYVRQRNIINADKQITETGIRALTKDQTTLWINNAGPYTETYYVRKGENVLIRLELNFRQVSSRVINDLIDKNAVKIYVEGANKNSNLEITIDNYNFSASYVAQNEGNDKVFVSIDGTNIEYEFKVVALDSSFFTIPISIATGDVSFKTGGLLSIGSTETFPGGKRELGSWGWYEDFPGYIEYKFTPEGKEFKYAYLQIYAIADGIIDKYDPNNPLTNYIFLQNLKELTNNISEKPRVPEKLNIKLFPPVNASAGPTNDVSFLDFQNGTGLRYTIDGYYQAYDPSDYPIYTYQGITNDGKYFVLFRYSNLYSPRLESYLKKPMPLWDKDNRESYDSYISRSFLEVKKEHNFSPSIKELDEFVKSIKISY